MGVTPCNGGNAAPIPGANQTVVMTAAAVESLLVLVGLEPVALVLAPFIAGTTYDLTNLCNNDPPADPGLTGQDIIDATNFANPLVSIPAIAKARQWFERIYWFYGCACVNGVSPTIPTPSNPGNQFSLNPGIPTANPQGSCWSASTTLQQIGGGNAILTNLLLPTLPVTNSAGQSFIRGGAIPQPSPQQVNITITNVNENGVNVNSAVSGTWQAFDKDVNTLNTLQTFAGPTPGRTTTVVLQMPTNTALITLAAQDGQTLVVHRIKYDLAIFCGPSGTNSLVTPCCPPDPLLEIKLNQALGMLQFLIDSTANLPLVTSTAHSGLTGSGTITLGAKTVAVQVSITTDNPSLKVGAGSPPYLFDRGYIVPIALMGPIRSEVRLVYTPQLYHLPPLTEQIGYTFLGGITATITELTN